jgi:hypothetical protein
VWIETDVGGLVIGRVDRGEETMYSVKLSKFFETVEAGRGPPLRQLKTCNNDPMVISAIRHGSFMAARDGRLVWSAVRARNRVGFFFAHCRLGLGVPDFQTIYQTHHNFALGSCQFTRFCVRLLRQTWSLRLSLLYWLSGPVCLSGLWLTGTVSSVQSAP